MMILSFIYSLLVLALKQERFILVSIRLPFFLPLRSVAREKEMLCLSFLLIISFLSSSIPIRALVNLNIYNIYDTQMNLQKNETRQ